jgi:hypothetical protein
MIWILAREQWRFQRMYMVWAAVIVAMALAFATFSSVSAATQGAIDQYSSHVLMENAAHNALVLLTDADFEVPDAPEDYGTPMTSGDLGRVIERANAGGADAYAVVNAWWAWFATGSQSGASEPPEPTRNLTVAMVWGQPDWDTILAEGTAPGPDDIVLPAEKARSLDVGIGDTVQVGHPVERDDGTWGFARDGDLTVSGVSYDISPYPVAYASHEQLPTFVAGYRAFGVTPPLVQGTVGWQHPSPELAPLTSMWGAPSLRTFGSTTALPWLLAGLFTAGAFVTAFTLGRAQAESRVRWVATAQALGARRSHLAGVAGLEWLAVGGAGALAGVGVGWLAVTWAHAHRMASVAAPPPVGVSFPLVVGVLLLSLAAILSAAIVSVPTVLAMHVPPVTALKATPTADSVHLTRSVPFWPIAVIFAATWLGTVAIGHSTFYGAFPLAVLCGIGAVASGIAVIVEASRTLVRATASRLGRSPRPWAIHASMTMLGHPQQATALAIIQALLITGIGGFILAAEPGMADFGWYAGLPLSEVSLVNRAADAVRQIIPAPLTVPTVLALLAAAQLLVMAIAASSRRVAWTESSTAGALGLTGPAVTRGDAFAWWSAQAIGAALGVVASLVGVGGVWLSVWSGSESALGDGLLGELPWRAAAVTAVALTSLLFAAVVAGLAGWLLRPRLRAERTRSAA